MPVQRFYSQKQTPAARSTAEEEIYHINKDIHHLYGLELRADDDELLMATGVLSAPRENL